VANIPVAGGQLKYLNSLKGQARSAHLAKMIAPHLTRASKGKIPTGKWIQLISAKMGNSWCGPCRKGKDGRIQQILKLGNGFKLDMTSKAGIGRNPQVGKAIEIAKASAPTGITMQALRSHNQVRAQVGQRPLKASSDLTKIAQKWANQLARSCKMYHQKDPPFGENLGWSSEPTNINKIISAWAAKKKNYKLKQNICPKGKQCYHYTQMVWAGTTEVGCAKQRCSNGSGGEVYVCNYFPAGNIVGARPFKP